MVFLIGSQNGNIFNSFPGAFVRNSFAFSPDGKWLATTQVNGVAINRLSDNTFHDVLEGSYGDGLSSQSFSRDGDHLVTSGFENGERVIQIWNTHDWSLYNSWKMNDQLVGQLIFSPDGETVVLVESRDWEIRFYKIADGRLAMSTNLSALAGVPRVHALVFSPDGRKLLTISRECESPKECQEVLRVWQTETGNLIYKIRDIQEHQRLPPSPPYYSDIPSLIAWSPNGELFAAGFSDGDVEVFRASDGKLLQTLTGHTMMVMGVAFSPNGQILASASLDGTIRLWGIK